MTTTGALIRKTDPQDGGDAEEQEPDQEHSLAAVPVAEDAGGKQETAKGQGIGGRDPLKITCGGAKFRREGGEGRDENGRIKANDQTTDDEGSEGPPAAGTSLGGCFNSCLSKFGAHGRHLLRF